MEISRARTMIAGQLKFHMTRARTSAIVPRWMLVNSWVNTKNSATAKISSGMTNEKIMTVLETREVRECQRSIPMANATPRGTAIRVVKKLSRTVWTTEARRAGSCSTEFTGSVTYQRREKPCQVLCDFPALNENRTARAMGRIDQAR